MATKVKSEIKRLSFNTIKYDTLAKIVNIKPKIDHSAFNEWFKFDYKLTDSDEELLHYLINKYAERLASFLEEELKAKFIIPILNKVDFYTENFRDWYERTIKGKINGYELSGIVDFMVAEGIREPSTPFFFITEFKQTKPTQDPQEQLLAELIVAIEANKHTSIFGAFIIGAIWKFVILKKDGQNSYAYYESKAFDSLWYDDLKQIYINLQAVKALYCKE